METARVLITEMPGPTWWEFLMQWGGLVTQAVAAAATLAAVLIALRLARRDAEWRQEIEVREQEFLNSIVNIDIGNFGVALRLTKGLIAGIEDIPDDQRYTPELVGALRAMVGNCKVEACWRVVDRLNWLSTGRRGATARIMGRAPMVKNACETLANWPMEQAGRQEFARHFVGMMDLVLAECERHFPNPY